MEFHRAILLAYPFQKELLLTCQSHFNNNIVRKDGILRACRIGHPVFLTVESQLTGYFHVIPFWCNSNVFNCFIIGNATHSQFTFCRCSFN